jgi:hypothetical protein
MNSRQRISALRRLGHQLLKDWTETTEIDTRRGAPGGPQDTANESHWDLKAVFEIEGCNIPMTKNALFRHRKCFKRVAKLYGDAVESFVVLYTAAHDRKHPFNRPALEDELDDRIKWGKKRRASGSLMEETSGWQSPRCLAMPCRVRVEDRMKSGTNASSNPTSTPVWCLLDSRFPLLID